MELTYKILGGDGQEYGPVTAQQFLAWVREGRASGESQVMRSDSSEWHAASAFPEFNLAPIPSAPMAQPVNVSDVALEQRLKSGAGWFYWIAGFSVINSILVYTGAHWSFALGLGITALLDAMATQFAGRAMTVAITFNILAAGIVAAFGYFANKRHGWAFIIGMIVLAIDTVLTGLYSMWLSLGLHVWAIISIFSAYRACRALKRS